METKTYEICGIPENEFKSYYVVWKLKNPYIVGIAAGGLNRTMQYGNPAPIAFSPSQSARFKSYYVVWKQ